MTPERWAEIDRVWHAVLARPEAERVAAVAELCGGDAELRQEVELLLVNMARASAAGFGAAPGVAAALSIALCSDTCAHRLAPPAVRTIAIEIGELLALRC